MPSRLPNKLALILAGLLIVMPQQSFAQRYGGGHGRGGWHGGGGHGYQRGYAGYGGRHGYRGYGGYGGYPGYGYRGYVAYPRYYGYGGYYGGYYHHHNNDGVWIALGAGLLGLIVGSAIARPRVYQYAYPNAAPPPPQAPAPAPPPATPRCQDGSPVPPGGYCTGPSEPSGERG